MRILALDLGTKTGWALWNGVTRTFGTVDLLPDAERRKTDKKKLQAWDPRPLRLFEFIQRAAPSSVVYESVLFASTQMQAMLYGSLRGAMMVAAGPQTTFLPVSVGTLKKFATGAGNAQKDEMADALRLAEPGGWLVNGRDSLVRHSPGNPDHLQVVDNNAVDAVWLLKFFQNRPA